MWNNIKYGALEDEFGDRAEEALRARREATAAAMRLEPAEAFMDVDGVVTAEDLNSAKFLYKKSRRTKKSHENKFPSPSEAMFLNLKAKVAVQESASGLCKFRIVDENSEFNGFEIDCLKSRIFSDGKRFEFEKMDDEIKPGDEYHLDLARNEEKILKAVLAWRPAYNKPSTSSQELLLNSTSLSNRKTEFYRARVINFDLRDSAFGLTSGLLQIFYGFKGRNSGEKVVFDRRRTFIFGACMANADLAYVMRENEKVYIRNLETILGILICKPNSEKILPNLGLPNIN